MELEQYLKERGGGVVTNELMKELAEEVGVHVEAVKAWRLKKWRPNPRNQDSLTRATEGKVTALDFPYVPQ